MLEGEFMPGASNEEKLKAYKSMNQKAGKNTACAKPKENPVWDKYEQPEAKDYAKLNAKAEKTRFAQTVFCFLTPSFPLSALRPYDEAGTCPSGNRNSVAS